MRKYIYKHTHTHIFHLIAHTHVLTYTIYREKRRLYLREERAHGKGCSGVPVEVLKGIVDSEGLLRLPWLSR